MKRWFLRIAVVLCALALLAVAGWWVWRQWYSADQIRAAIWNHDMDRVSLLIRLGAPVEADVELYVDPSGETVKGKLLQWAAYYNHPALAKLLLAHGAEVDARDTDSRTPLHYITIIQFGRMDDGPAVAKLLLVNGADPNAKDKDSKTPLDKMPELAEIVKELEAEKARKKQSAQPKVVTP